jgi:chromosome segregation ATPase
MKLKQKELEIQRITNEFKANEAHLLAQMKEMKNKDNDDVQQYKLIVSNLEMKVEELDKVYNSEKEKIKNELNDSINKLKKENKKLKSEKNKLVQMCSELKIEINRLENNLSIIQSKQNEVFDCIDDDEYFEQNNNNDNNDIYN